MPPAVTHGTGLLPAQSQQPCKGCVSNSITTAVGSVRAGPTGALCRTTKAAQGAKQGQTILAAAQPATGYRLACNSAAASTQASDFNPTVCHLSPACQHIHGLRLSQSMSSIIYHLTMPIPCSIFCHQLACLSLMLRGPSSLQLHTQHMTLGIDFMPPTAVYCMADASTIPWTQQHLSAMFLGE
jgi:hypothetical protein